jgi:hypothetical protein
MYFKYFVKSCVNKGTKLHLRSTQEPFAIKVLTLEEMFHVKMAILHMICFGLSLAGQVANSSTVKRHSFDFGPMSENTNKLLFPLPWCNQWVCT